MDIATIIGLVAGTILVIGSILIGGSILPFFNVAAIMITVGGSIAALLINFPLKSVLTMFRVVKKCFVTSLPSPEETLEQFNTCLSIYYEKTFSYESKQLLISKDHFAVYVSEM